MNLAHCFVGMAGLMAFANFSNEVEKFVDFVESWFDQRKA